MIQYKTNHYKVIPPYGNTYMQMRDDLNDIKIGIKSIEEDTKREIAALDQQLEVARKEKDFFEESYLQHYYPIDDILIRKNKRLFTLLSTLYTVCELNFKKILLLKNIPIRNKGNKESQLSVLFEHLKNVLDINFSFNKNIKEDLHDLKFLRNWEEHDGYDLTLSDETIIVMIHDYCNKAYAFLDFVIESLYLKKNIP